MSEQSKEKYQKFDDEQNENESVSIKIKSLDGNVQSVKAILKDTILQFKKSHFSKELENQKIVKIIYRGRLLKDDEIIETINFPKDTFVHVSIQNDPNPPKPQPQPEPVQIPVAQNQENNQQQVNNNNNEQDNNTNANNNNNRLPDDLERQLQATLNQQEMQELRQIISGNNPAPQNGQAQADAAGQPAAEIQPDSNLSARSAKLEFIIGFFIGFLFGFIGLIFIMFCSVSQNQKYGAMIGFTTSVMYQILFVGNTRNTSKSNQETAAQSQSTYADDSLVNGNEFISNFFMSPMVVLVYNYFIGF